MRYLRSIYFPKSMFNNKIERMEFAPITILCGNEESQRSEILEYICNDMFDGYLNGYYEDNLWEQLIGFQDIGTENDDKQEELYEEFDKSIGWLHHFEENCNIYDTAEDRTYKSSTLLRQRWDAGNETIAEFEVNDNDIPILPIHTLFECSTDIVIDAAYYSISPEDFSVSECVKSKRSDFRDFDLCFLDLPEFGLSIDETQELVEYIEKCARLYSVQFVIATESPIIASINEALIYDMDGDIVKTKEWKDVEIVKKFYEFFNEQLK